VRGVRGSSLRPVVALTAVVAAAVAMSSGTAGAVGTPPTVTLSKSSFDFGHQQVGIASPAQSATLTLTCGTSGFPCHFSPAITSSNPAFGVSSGCPADLVAPTTSASCTVTATFTPLAAGVTAGTLSTGTFPAGEASASGTAGPTASLTGTGVAAAAATRRCNKGANRSAHESKRKKKRCKNKKKK
jgi:hypothetical protein